MNRSIQFPRPLFILTSITIATFILFQLIHSVASAATFTVTNTNDDGAGSLRQAISATLSSPGADRITFDPALDGQTITLTSGTLVLSGAVEIDASSLPNDVIISGNDAHRIFLIRFDSIVTMTNVTLVHGQTITNLFACESVCGGAIYSEGGTHTVIRDSKFMHNRANSAGAILDNGTMIISNTLFTDNRATFNGGAIQTGDIMTITHSQIISNSTENGPGGGGIFNQFSRSLYIEKSTIANNSAVGNGGGLLTQSPVFNGQTKIVNSTFSDNSATSKGGAIYTEPSFMGNDKLILNQNTLYRNQAPNQGGAIFADATFTSTLGLSLSQNTIYGNVGGGVYITSNGASTITAPMQNNIIANNTAGNDCSGSLTDAGNNIASDTSCNLGSGNNTDPLLGLFQDNGGPTMTLGPLLGSPIINGANSNGESTDQRGVIRPQGDAADIGAFEAILHRLTVSKTGNGDGTIMSVPTVVDCGLTCTTSLIPEQSIITLTATADADSTFAGWQGACSGTADCTLTFTETKMVMATFIPNEYTVYLPIIQSEDNTLTSFSIGPTTPIAARPINQKGETFFTNSLDFPTLDPSKPTYLSASGTGLAPALVDDVLQLIVNNAVVFEHDFGNANDDDVSSKLIQLSSAQISALSEQTVTVILKDKYGVQVESTQLFIVIP